MDTNKYVKKLKKEANKRERASKYRKVGRILLIILLFPIYLFLLFKEACENAVWATVKWDEKRADKILNYYLPKVSDWNEEEKCMYYFSNGIGTKWSKKIKRKDRRFWRKYQSEIRKYLINTFEIPNTTKEVGNCSEGWTEVQFYFN